MKENRCIHCGAIIPEGRLSCYICENEKLSKHDKVMMELADIANVLKIVIDYVEEEGIEYLVCDGQKIVTTGASLSGIRQEFFGYVFLKEWKYKLDADYYKKFINYIKLPWVYEIKIWQIKILWYNNRRRESGSATVAQAGGVGPNGYGVK